jgi:hypothetical protein
MSDNRTLAGKLAEEYPELGRRELSALAAESERTIVERAEEAEIQRWYAAHPEHK